MKSPASRIPALVKAQHQELLGDWMKAQLASAALRPDLLKESELREQSRAFLSALQAAAQRAPLDEDNADGWAAVKDILTELSRSRAQAGFSSAETATFVLSLKLQRVISAPISHLAAAA